MELMLSLPCPSGQKGTILAGTPGTWANVSRKMQFKMMQRTGPGPSTAGCLDPPGMERILRDAGSGIMGVQHCDAQIGGWTSHMDEPVPCIASRTVKSLQLFKHVRPTA